MNPSGPEPTSDLRDEASAPSAPAGQPHPLGSDRAALRIEMVLLDPGLGMPTYARPGDAGADLQTAVDLRLEPGQRSLVPTGVAIALPDGYVALVHPRSGLAARHGLSIVNAPGTVDAGYRGEITVLLVNLDRHEAIELRRGDRIAQLVVQRVERAAFVLVDTLPQSERGVGGYGSTGGFGASPPEPYPGRGDQ